MTSMSQEFGCYLLKIAAGALDFLPRDTYVLPIRMLMKEAQLDGHHHEYILNVLRGKKQTYHGLKWMYLSDYEKSLVNQ